MGMSSFRTVWKNCITNIRKHHCYENPSDGEVCCSVTADCDARFFARVLNAAGSCLKSLSVMHKMNLRYVITKRHKVVAILLVILATFFASSMGAFIKHLQSELNVCTVGFFRFFLGLIIIAPYLIYSNFESLKTPNIKIHFVRSTINCPAMYLGFGALRLMPLEKVSAIHFAVPLFVTIMAIIFLKERICVFRTSAIIVGFIGMLIMIRPGIVIIDTGTKMALCSAFFWSFAILLVKTLSKKDSAITIISYQYMFMTVFTFIVVLFKWQTPTTVQFMYLLLAALSGTVFHLLTNQACKLVDLTLTQPFAFLGLIWGSLFGFMFFNETPNIFTWIGGTVIFSSVFLITVRESQLNKDISHTSFPIRE